MARRPLAWLAPLVATGCLAAAPAAGATVYTVSGTSDPSPTPLCTGTTCISLRSAVNAANADPGSTIQLGSNTYVLSQGALSLTQNLTITGTGAPATTIQQTAKDRVIRTAVGTTIAISGLKITGGDLTGPGGGGVMGGGILNYGTMTLTDVAVSANKLTGGDGASGGAAAGGAGDRSQGAAIETGDQSSDANSLTLISSTVTNNQAQGGHGGSSSGSTAGSGGWAQGAIYGDFRSTIVLRDSTVTANQITGGTGGAALSTGSGAGAGGLAAGAVYAQGALTIADSTIANNTVTGGNGGSTQGTGQNGGSASSGCGGAVFINVVSAGKLTITGSTLANNTASGGGGGVAFNGGNGGGGGAGCGAGIAIAAGASTIVNSTIADNSAAGGAGGAGSTDGAQGSGSGGGIDTGGIDQLMLASDTLTGNSAVGASGTGGNLTGQHVTVGATIIAGGSTSSGQANCNLSGANIDNGNNLEDTTPSQCGFSSARADLIGVGPVLMPLGANGGPTQTEALSAGSPALGAGGSCTDPSQSGNPALGVDQRGLPRPPGMCDIGAYQFQPPGAAGAPTISGAPALGQQLTCGQGNWTGDQLSFSYQWLRDGNPITGANGTSFSVIAADAGHLLACRATASNAKGSASQASNAVSVPSSSSGGGGSGGGGTAAPLISGASETNKIWVVGHKLAQISRTRRHPIGTVFSFRLNEVATVRFTFMRSASGRRVGKHCVAPTGRNRTKRACTRLVSAGSLRFAGHFGLNKVFFQGRLRSSGKLKPGKYTLVVTATNPAGQQSSKRTLRFTIVKR